MMAPITPSGWNSTLDLLWSIDRPEDLEISNTFMLKDYKTEVVEGNILQCVNRHSAGRQVDSNVYQGDS